MNQKDFKQKYASYDALDVNNIVVKRGDVVETVNGDYLIIISNNVKNETSKSLIAAVLTEQARGKVYFEFEDYYFCGLIKTIYKDKIKRVDTPLIVDQLAKFDLAIMDLIGLDSQKELVDTDTDPMIQNALSYINYIKELIYKIRGLNNYIANPDLIKMEFGGDYLNREQTNSIKSVVLDAIRSDRDSMYDTISSMMYNEKIMNKQLEIPEPLEAKLVEVSSVLPETKKHISDVDLLADDIISYYQTTGENYKKVAEHFGVSEYKTRILLKNSGVLRKRGTKTKAK